MSVRVWHLVSGPAMGWVAGAIVALIGAATAVTLAATARGDVPTAAAGGVVIAMGFVALLVAGWTDGLTVLLLAIPLPAAYSAGARLTLVAPLTAVIVFAWVVNWGIARRRLVLGAFPVLGTAALLVAFAIATLFAEARVLAVRESINIGVLIALFVAATELLGNEPVRRRRVVDLLVTIAGACGLLAILESVQILPGEFPRWETPFNRAALGFGQPNALGLFLAVTLPLATHKLVSARSNAQRVRGVAVTLLVAFGLVATFSRGSWLAVFVGAAALAFAGAGKWTVRIWIVAVLGAVVTDVVSGGVLRDTIQRTMGDWVLEQRAVLMLAGLLMFFDHPLVGVGPGGFGEQLERYAVQIPELWDLQATPHNAYVQMGAETGAIGVAALLCFLVAVLAVAVRRARATNSDRDATVHERSLRRALLWSTATIVVAGLVVWPFSHGSGQAVVVVMALTVAAVGGAKDPAPGHRR